MRRPEHEQLNHDSMVRVMADHFIKEGYVVSADIRGYNSPPLVNGHRPDVAVYSMGRLTIILEVETESTYSSSHTHDQFRAFYSALGVKFHATVPKGILAAAQRTAASWGGPPSKWWYI